MLQHSRIYVTLIFMLYIILSLSACGKVEITMQEIYNAGQTEVMFESHQSVSIQNMLLSASDLLR